jgi:hypothetical protein
MTIAASTSQITFQMTDAKPKAVVASHLPRTSSTRETGLIFSHFTDEFHGVAFPRGDIDGRLDHAGDEPHDQDERKDFDKRIPEFVRCLFRRWFFRDRIVHEKDRVDGLR